MLEFIFTCIFSAASPVKQPEKPVVLPQRALTVWRIEEVPLVDDEVSDDEE